MGKKAHLEIKESVLELKDKLKNKKSLKAEKRIKSLIAIKEEKFNTRQEVADYVLVSLRTLERWIDTYKAEGLESLLTNKPKPKQSKFITPIIHEELSRRVNDPHNPFLGYYDAKEWVKNEFGVEVQYNLIRRYLINHFKTKLKSPRKSHYKKDPEAENAFLKTP